MSARSLQRIKVDMPDWLTPGQVGDTLAEVFEAAADGEEVEAAAEVLMEVMVRAAENEEWIDDANERLILTWVRRNWTDEPRALFNRLCALAANLQLPEAQALLQARHDEQSDADLKAELRAVLDDLARASDESAC